MADWHVRTPQVTDVPAIVSAMRPWDLVECAMHAVSPEDYLLSEVLHGYNTLTLVDGDGAPVAIGGVTPYAFRQGRIWMLGTEAIEAQPRAFQCAARRYVHLALSGFDRLDNFVPAQRRGIIKWLVGLGFSIGEPYRHVSGLEVVPFSWVRPSPVQASGV